MTTLLPIRIYCDNSRRACAEKCLRKRYWNYEYRGRGIETIRKGKSEFPLLTGTGVHWFIEALLNGVDTERVKECVTVYDHFDCQQDERLLYLVNEQRALIEAIGRAWHATKYQQFIERYEVLDIEREESVGLAPGVVWMSRPDILVRRKVDGALFIVNLKTTKKADERWVSQWPLNMQTLSEVVAVEARLNADYPYGGKPEEIDLTLKLSGVIILGLLKGEQREYPPDSGCWYHDSPLIWGWNNVSGKAHPMGEWTARWKWSDEEGNHTLGKGWRKREIWLHYPGGVKAWIEHLAATDPAILEEQVVELPPILRNESQIYVWKDTVVHQERMIRHNRVCLEKVSGDSEEQPGRTCQQRWLDETFPMSTSAGNCLWPSKCSYFSICHEGADPDDEERFVPRVPNHPQEQVNAR